MRTSLSHPLQIATVKAPGIPGAIGITFCPGKKQPNAATGAWDRDLGLDLDAIRVWGAATIITLIEPLLSPVWTWLAVREVPPFWTFAGGAVIVLAIVIQALAGAIRDRKNANSAARPDRRRAPAFDPA